jgi:hypothetical protein
VGVEFVAERVSEEISFVEVDDVGDGWKGYAKRNKTRSKAVEKAFRAGFASGRARSANALMAMIADIRKTRGERKRRKK